MKLRSYNPNLKLHFESLPKPTHQYGFKSINSPAPCQMLLDKVQLRQKYPHSKGRLDILDVFSGFGLLSTMINYELKPRNHIVLDNTKDNLLVWQARIKYLEKHTGNAENFRYLNMDGYAWETYDKIIKELHILEPQVQPRDNVHDELFIVANLTSVKTGESLFAQWIQCCAFQNWLQKYGRVRMLLLVRETTTLKFLAGPNFQKRNRASLKREVFTDCKLLAVSDTQVDEVGTAGCSFDPNLLVKDQPILIPSNAISPIGGDLSVVEVVPRHDLGDLDINAVDYLSQVLMYRSSNTVAESLETIAPGAREDLSPLLPDEILQKSARLLTRDDLLKIHSVYSSWAFRPSFEDTLNFFSEETRSF